MNKELLLSSINNELGKGETELALDGLYTLCTQYYKQYLLEVVGLKSRLRLIDKRDVIGAISFEERLKYEAQISSSIFKVVSTIEREDINEKSLNNVIQDLQTKLELENSRRAKVEFRILQLENHISSTLDSKDCIKIRDHIIEEKIECKIIGVGINSEEKISGLIIGRKNSDSGFLVVIDENQIEIIALAIERIDTIRPLTHDLLALILSSLDCIVKEIIIDLLDKGIFYSKIVMIHRGKLIEIDSRPSDAIAISVKHDIPIFVNKSILDKLDNQLVTIENP